MDYDWPKLLKACRLQRNETQQTFGHRFGVGKNTVCRWETGERKVPLHIATWLLKNYLER